MARKTTDAFKKLVGAYSSGNAVSPLEKEGERHDLLQEDATLGVVPEEIQQDTGVAKSYIEHKNYDNLDNPNNSYGYKNYERRTPGRPKRTDGKENKSRHFNLLLRPSTYTALEQIARLDGGSISDILNSLAEDYIESRAEDLASFRLLLKKR